MKTFYPYIIIGLCSFFLGKAAYHLGVNLDLFTAAF